MGHSLYNRNSDYSSVFLYHTLLDRNGNHSLTSDLHRDQKKWAIDNQITKKLNIKYSTGAKLQAFTRDEIYGA